MDKLTVEQLREIRSRMTWGDQTRAKAAAKDDSELMAKHAMHRSAMRLGLAGENFDEFLDGVEVEALTAALESHEADPTPSDSTPT